jgi:hypothetical protein
MANPFAEILRGAAASPGRIDRVEGGKRDAFGSNWRETSAMASDWTEFAARWPSLTATRLRKPRVTRKKSRAVTAITAGQVRGK